MYVVRQPFVSCFRYKGRRIPVHSYVQPVRRVLYPYLCYILFLNFNFKTTLMAKFYPTFSVVRFTKSFLLFTALLCTFYASQAQVYYASLTGSNEVPSNTSPGTGKAVITIDGNFMRVQVTYSGLVAQTSAGAPSGTTAS